MRRLPRKNIIIKDEGVSKPNLGPTTAVAQQISNLQESQMMKPL